MTAFRYTKHAAGPARMLASVQQVDADIVAGVPDSAIAAAQGYAEASGIPYGDVLVKNRYIGRTFITPKQQARELAVRLKLSVLKKQVAGKRVLLVDDSIVRGTNSIIIARMLRDAGAKDAHLFPAGKISLFIWHQYTDEQAFNRRSTIGRGSAQEPWAGFPRLSGSAAFGASCQRL